MASQIYDITIQKEDRVGADAILLAHWHNGDIDTIKTDESTNSDGIKEVTFWIRPYVYEDLEAIKNEFTSKGILLL